MTKEEIAAVRAMAFRECADYCNDVASRNRKPRLVREDIDRGEERALGADMCAAIIRCWVDAEEIKAGVR